MLYNINTIRQESKTIHIIKYIIEFIIDGRSIIITQSNKALQSHTVVLQRLLFYSHSTTITQQLLYNNNTIKLKSRTSDCRRYENEYNRWSNWHSLFQFISYFLFFCSFLKISLPLHLIQLFYNNNTIK